MSLPLSYNCHILETFAQLPATSRVWIYQADRTFTDGETTTLQAAISDFVSKWLAHKAKVIGDGALFYHRFVILVADEEKLKVSGCSIDSTVRFVKEIGAQYGVNFFDRFYTCYLQDGHIKGCDFETFKGLYQSGTVSNDTIVFNNIVHTIEGLNSQWQIPLQGSWQKKML